MTVSTQLIANALIIVALVVWIGYRQTTWRAVDAGRMWRMPIIMAVIGVATLGGLNIGGLSHLGSAAKGASLTGTGVAMLLVELVVSVGLGAIMGAVSTFRPMSREAAEAYARRRADDRHPSTSMVALESRTGWLGLVLWLLLIATRVGLDALAAHLGAAALASTGIILLTVATNRAARVAVILYRAGRMGATVSA